MLSLTWSMWLVCALAPSDVEPPAEPPEATTVPEADGSTIQSASPEAEDPALTDPAVEEQDVPPEPGSEPETETEPGTEAEPDEAEDAEPEAEPEAAEDTELEPEAERELSSAMDALEPAPLSLLAPKHRLVYKNLFALRYNPLGLVNENSMGWAMRLYEKRGALFEPAYLGVKLHTFVSPAYSRVGPQVEFSPLAILNLTATYDFIGYYGTFNQMQSFGTPAVNYSDTQLEINDGEGASYPTYGSMVTLSALLQAKAGPVAIRDNLKGYYTDFKLRDGGNVF